MTTHIIFVLDETGSMNAIKDDVIGGFNSYVDDLRNNLDDVKFSLMKFDSNSMDWIYDDVFLFDVDPLTTKNYVPGAATPLWDAFGQGIKAAKIKDIKPEDKVIITVLTDGFENASKEYTSEMVKDLIEEHKDDWAITFLGADMDAWSDVGAGIGMYRGSTLSADSQDYGGTFHAHSVASINYARGVTGTENFYDNDEDSLYDQNLNLDEVNHKHTITTGEVQVDQEE